MKIYEKLISSISEYQNQKQNQIFDFNAYYPLLCALRFARCPLLPSPQNKLGHESEQKTEKILNFARLSLSRFNQTLFIRLTYFTKQFPIFHFPFPYFPSACPCPMLIPISIFIFIFFI